MKRAASVAALLLFAGCENQKSPLDTVSKATAPSVTTVAAEADHTGDTDTRLRRLEDSNAANAEALGFLNKVYQQQKQQQAQQAREEHAPDAMFAVDITPDLKAGQVEGPNSAMVTIVEAWDFA